MRRRNYSPGTSLHSSGSGLYPLLSDHICPAALTHAGQNPSNIFLSAAFHTCIRPMNLATRPHIADSVQCAHMVRRLRSSGKRCFATSPKFVRLHALERYSRSRVCAPMQHGYMPFGIRLFPKRGHFDCYASLKIDYRLHINTHSSMLRLRIIRDMTNFMVCGPYKDFWTKSATFIASSDGERREMTRNYWERITRNHWERQCSTRNSRSFPF